MLFTTKRHGSASRLQRLVKNSGGAFESWHRFGYGVVSV